MSGRRRNCCPIPFRLTSWMPYPIWSVFTRRLRRLITREQGHHPIYLVYPYSRNRPLLPQQRLCTTTPWASAHQLDPSAARILILAHILLSLACGWEGLAVI